ncbi:MAG: DNA cytosine methyltransferase [Methanobrevibacter sp.]|jgi:DNA (cytosine-5)-methyltransferase 1|nr:DNA cytosine methyltransferase [Candidatus Methanovirga meridionalis]
MEKKFTFIDLFSGIGGFRIGMENAGFKCVGSSEIDPHARLMYERNFREIPKGDITKLDPSAFSDFDVLCAGFPCQSFSICGLKKGFKDETRGTLFFDICRILEKKNPPVFILENVSHLKHHDRGRTIGLILEKLTKLGYTVDYKVLNAKNFGVPQNRERIIIIGNKYGLNFNFDKLKINSINSMKLFLDENGSFEILDSNQYTLIKEFKKQKKSGLIFRGYMNKKIRKNGVRKNTNHLSRVHKQPNRIYSSEGNHPTIPSTETSGRYWIYDDGIVRKLTIDECYRFMGFPEDFIKVGSKTSLYERIGNSICVPMVESIGTELIHQFMENENAKQRSYKFS